MKSMRPGQPNKRGNIVTARLVPLFLLGIIGYSTYVITKLVCIDYLIQPHPSVFVHRQTGAGIAILVVLCLLLLITLATFGRLLQTITFNPGLVPRGPHYYVEKERARRNSGRPSHKEAALEQESNEGYTPREFRPDGAHEGYQAQNFWHKDVFVCGWDGRPPFCSTCYNYKPDRAHHCSELGRCVLKMDHFCPWVGGIVSETSFKYFIQFTFWASLLCLHALIVMAYYFAQRRREDHFVNVHWILVLVFSALFFTFNAGMCGSSLQLAFVNSTTIENFTRKTKVWYLAVSIPTRVLERYNSLGRDDLRLITYPRPPSEQFQILKQSGATLDASEHNVTREALESNSPGTPRAAYDAQPGSDMLPIPPGPQDNAYQSQPQTSSLPSSSLSTLGEQRMFAILATAPGENPFDVGPLNNFREVMGYNLIDWLFPLRASPLVDHGNLSGTYKFGQIVRRLRKEAGLNDVDAVDAENDDGNAQSQKKRRRRRRSSVHTGIEPTRRDGNR